MQNPISEQARAAALAQLDAAETAREDILVQHIANGVVLSLIHISEPTRQEVSSRMPSSA